MNKTFRVAFLLPSFEDGGVERVTINLALGLKSQGYTVEFVCFQKKGHYLSYLPEDMKVVELGAGRSVKSIPRLLRYFKEERPDMLFSAKHYINTSVLIAKLLARTNTKVIVSGHGMFNGKPSGVLPLLMRWLYPKADAIAAVSQGVAENISKIVRIPQEKIQVIYNPVITESFVNMYEQTASISKSAGIKQVVSIGRLSREKDFTTLLKAFQLLKEIVPSKLTIVGEGPERENLETLIKDLKLEKDVSLPGFTENPLEYLKGADAFVLSSLTEGLPTVIIEALYTGVPIVSTDCPSGPLEILENGKYGVLTPVGDFKALSHGIQQVLATPPSLESQRKRALDFTSEKAVKGYEKLIFSLLK